MATKNFNKEEFVQDGDRYQIEFSMKEIGGGSDLTIERKKDDGEYEIVQAEVNRHENSFFVVWSEPFNGRLIFEK